MSDRAVQLITKGMALASIVVSPDAGEVEVFAADELARYLGRIGGAQIATAATPSDGLLPIRIGLRKDLEDQGAVPPPKSGSDGYSLLVGSEGIVVAGDNPRGVLYGVYDLLERIGCRWYYPQIDPQDGEIIPSLETVELAPFAVSEAAGFESRLAHPGSMIYNLNVAEAKAQADWAAKARYNIMLFLFSGKAEVPAQAKEDLPDQATEPRLPTPEDFWEGSMEYETSGVAPELRKRGIILAGPEHSMLYFLPNTLFDEHPEWFGMDADGRRWPQGALRPEFCWSNPEAVELFTDNTVRWLQDNPHIEMFTFMPNDGGRACLCDECRKSTPSDLYAHIANTILRKAKALGIHTPMEITGGYAPVSEPPQPGALDPSIRMHWAHWGRRHDDWYGGADYGMRENLDTWIASGIKFTMVNYYTDAFATPAIHPPVASCLDRDNQWLLEQGVQGNASLMFPARSWWAHGLNAWLGISWYYSDRHATEFLDDYCLNYFGAAAEPMREYHRVLDQEMWLGYFCQGTRWEAAMWMGADERDKAGPWIDRLEALLDSAEELATSPEDRYRLSRLAAQGRALVLAGRARVANGPLREAFERELGAGAVSADVLSRMQAALEHEESVVDPAMAKLHDMVAVVGDHELTKLMGGAARKLREDLATAGAAVAAAAPA